MGFSDEELRLLFKVGCGEGVEATVGVQGVAQKGRQSYKEVQVHGPLRFAEDFSLLVVPVRLRGTPAEDAAASFSERFGVPILWV